LANRSNFGFYRWRTCRGKLVWRSAPGCVKVLGKTGENVAIAADVTDRTVAVVLAGGKGTRLDPLTRDVCKPALPFGGAYRCIDFSLSNCVNSGLRVIGVATQYQPSALLDHLWSNWNSVALGHDVVVRAWRAEERAARFGYRGTADAVYRNLPSIELLESSLVLILAGDHVYKMDYRPMLEAHAARRARVTIACVEVASEDAKHFGVVAPRDDALVERFVEKPRSPAETPRAPGRGVIASMGVYVFDGAYLAEILRIDAERRDSEHDFGNDILPHAIAERCAFSYLFRDRRGAPGYWRDIGTLDSYWRAQMELLGGAPPLRLDDRAWPIGRVAPASHWIGPRTPTAEGGIVEDTITTAGCDIGGHVARSVLSADVVVRRGATVADTVALPGAVIGARSRLRGVIVDAGCHVAEGTIVERSNRSSEPPVLTAPPHGAAGDAAARWRRPPGGPPALRPR
jgi:glucose-1-phosphate adenylyltransferase